MTLVVSLLLGNVLFAHGDEDHKKEQKDTTQTEQPATAHEHSMGQEGHHDLPVLKEVDIVDASLSDFSNLHPLVVHFPIVLLLLAALTQIAAFFFWKKQMNWATLLLLLGGFLGAYVASIFVHPHTTGLTEAASAVLEKHDQFAYLTIWLSGIGLLLKAVSLFFLKDKIWLEIIIALLLAGAAFTVSRAGHYGATLAHIHGVGAQGHFIESNDDGHNHNH